MDLDGDGHTDIISGSWPGEIYFFRRQPDGKFAAGVTLKGRDGKPLNIGSGSAAFATDWRGTGRPDLIVGTVLGEVWLIPNASDAKRLAFLTPRRLQAGSQPVKVNGEAAPVVADWDGDGKPDLIVGAGDGSVVWYRNVGSAAAAKLEPGRPLVGKSPVRWEGDDKRGPRDWGLCVKPCLFDWDGDGRLALLLGDRCGGFHAKPSQTEEEKEEESKANDRLPALRQSWAATFGRYRKAQDTAEQDALRVRLQRLKDEIAAVQEIQSHFLPGYQAHGFVWLFRRIPADRKTP